MGEDNCRCAAKLNITNLFLSSSLLIMRMKNAVYTVGENLIYIGVHHAFLQMYRVNQNEKNLDQFYLTF